MGRILFNKLTFTIAGLVLFAFGIVLGFALGIENKLFYLPICYAGGLLALLVFVMHVYEFLHEDDHVETKKQPWE